MSNMSHIGPEQGRKSFLQAWNRVKKSVGCRGLTLDDCLFVDFEGGKGDVRAVQVYWSAAGRRYAHWHVRKGQAQVEAGPFLAWFTAVGRRPIVVIHFSGDEPAIMLNWAPAIGTLEWVDLKSRFFDKSDAAHYARHHVGVLKESGKSFDGSLESYERVYGLIRPQAIWSRSKFYPEVNAVGAFSPLMILAGIQSGEANTEEVANLETYCRWDAESMYRICQAGLANDGRAAIAPGSPKA